MVLWNVLNGSTDEKEDEDGTDPDETAKLLTQRKLA